MDAIEQLAALIVTVVIAITVASIFFIWYLLSESRSKLFKLEEKHDFVNREVLMIRLSMDAQTGDSRTVRNMSMRPIIKRTIDEQMGMSDLKNMAADLELNGALIYNEGKDTLANGILDVMIKKRRIIDVALWMTENRSDIRF